MSDQIAVIWDDIPAIVANISILTLFVGLVFAGVAKGVKELKGLASSDGKTSIQAATILENITLSEWSASNRSVEHAITRLGETTDGHRRAVDYNTDELRAMRRLLNEVLDEMKRQGAVNATDRKRT